jgi:ankyrin repeat protein
MEAKHVVARIADAIDASDCANVEKLVRENPDQKSFYTPFGSQTWLGYAAQVGKLDVVQVLVANGLDVNAGDKYDDRKPLCSAAASNRYDVAAYLLSAGSVMDVSLSVQNPLFAAIVGRSPEIVRLLLQSGIDSKVRYTTETMKRMDAIAFALMRGEAECARIIALWNADGDEGVAGAALAEADQVAEENAR